MFQFAGTMDFASGFDLFLMRNTIARWKFEEQVDARDEQIDELQNSTSMKLGKILTAPMRKIKDGSGGRSNSTDGAGTQSTAGTANAENATNTAGATNIASSTSSGATSSTSSIATNTARPGVTFAKRSPQVIASFTSYPMRLDTIAPSVESLAGQTRKFDRIVLWLSRSQFPDGKLPAGMGRLFDMGLEIMWCDEDVRSYKRSVCSFEAFPEDILVFFDDDLIYREDSLETLLHSYEAHPNAVNALRVRRMQFDAKGALLPYSTWEVAHDQHVGEARMDLLATNGAGTLYPPHLMPDETLNAAKFMQLAPTADDIWLKFMQTIAGIPVVLAREFEELQYTEGTQEVCALWDDNEHLDLNDAAVAKLLEEYDQIHGADDTLLMRMRGSRA